MKTKKKVSPLFQVLSLMFSGMQDKRLRTFQEFAEEEIIITEGPRKGPFRCSFMPWTALVLAEFTRGVFQRFFASGPVQSGKTLIFFVIPLLYHLFEREEDVIIGLPSLDLGQKVWERKIFPILMKTRYAKLLPTKGPGSRGGKFT